MAFSGTVIRSTVASRYGRFEERSFEVPMVALHSVCVPILFIQVVPAGTSTKYGTGRFSMAYRYTYYV
jgi:hypothetical protein